MKRTALALAATVLGTGCIVTSDGTTNNTCDFRTLDIAWTFTNADGVARGCASPDGIQPAIQNADLFFDQQYVGRFPCANYGVTLDDSQGGLTPGSHAILVEGVDASGTIVVRDNYFATVNTCGASATTANATEGYARVNYAIAGGAACSGGYMWFAIRDDVASTASQPYIAAIVDQASTSALKTAYPCGTTLEFPLPSGDYTVLWLQEVGTPLTAPTALNQQCNDVPFSVTGPGTNGSPTVTLSPVTPTTPACY